MDVLGSRFVPVTVYHNKHESLKFINRRRISFWVFLQNEPKIVSFTLMGVGPPPLGALESIVDYCLMENRQRKRKRDKSETTP